MKGLLLAALAMIGVSTACYAEDPCTGGQSRQLASLRAIYYRGGELPPEPSEAELTTLRRLESKPKLRHQTMLLRSAFPDDERLQAFAIRDRDGGGIKDYRITKCGEFRENDPDVDCDGIANVLDDSPYDRVATPGAPCGREPNWHRVTNDHNGNGLPDKIDWRVLHPSAGDEERAEVQEGL